MAKAALADGESGIIRGTEKIVSTIKDPRKEGEIEEPRKIGGKEEKRES